MSRRPAPAHDAAGFRREAKKHLGQNFLHERGVIDKIVLAIDPRPGDRIVEIGPGQGALTFPLLRKHGEVTAIEFDSDLHAPLQAAAREHGHLHLIEGDVLGVDFSALAAQRGDAHGQIRLAGNLPYNLSSPILFTRWTTPRQSPTCISCCRKKWSSAWPPPPGKQVYGRLNVMLQAYCTVTPLFTGPAGGVPARPQSPNPAGVRLPAPNPRRNSGSFQSGRNPPNWGGRGFSGRAPQNPGQHPWAGGPQKHPLYKGPRLWPRKPRAHKNFSGKT